MKKVLMSLILGGIMAASASATPLALGAIGAGTNSFVITLNSLSAPTTMTFSTTSLGSVVCTGADGALCSSLTAGASTFTSGSTFTFTLGSGLTYVTNSVWVVTSTLVGSGGNGGSALIRTSGLYEKAGFDNTAGTLNFTLNDPNDGGALGKYNFSASGNVVPEPGSMALLGSGLVGLGFLARRRRQ